ncbi:chd-1 [Pristionchus pacificus]|nr:chd-1 [Pristionchus pacificus]
MWDPDSGESNSSSGSGDEAVNEDSRDPFERTAAEESKDDETKDGEEDDGEHSSDGKGEADSDYEDDDKAASVKGSDDSEEEKDSEDEEESEESEESDDSGPKKKKARKVTRKIDDKTIKLLESENYLRRSGRQRTEVSETRSSSRRSTGARKRKIDSDESEEESSSDWSDQPKRKKAVAPPKPNKKTSTAKGKKGPSYTSGGRKRVDYRENSSDDEVNEEDVLEWKEEEPELEKSTISNGSISGGDTVEKVLKYRLGVASATGPSTTCYNVEEKGDPNEGGEKNERQFLVKWQGWSHLHNTWESEASLAVAGAKGEKKIANYIKKLREVEEWRRSADKEYIEYYECEQGMADELLDEYKKVERVVAHQVSRDKKDDGEEHTEYLIKWTGLPYSECTWEDKRLIPRGMIEDYEERIENAKLPSRSAHVLKRRPKFVKLEEMPEYLGRGGKQKLRDYQLEGLNWMLAAWCKNNSSILADEMGLGKTIQSTSFLSSLSSIHDLHGPFLVVVPLSTMAAWQKELCQWAPGLNVVTYMGDMSSREFIRQYEWYAAGGKKMKINVVLTTYEILIKDKSFLGGVEWAALVVDEAHRLKNDDSLLYKCLSNFRTDHRLLITGTPLQNSMKELWALLHFIMPEEFPSWEDFDRAHAEVDHKGISSLHKKLEPYLLRRVKKDVEKSLPPKLEQILRVDMTREQKQFYKWILTKNYKELSKGVKGSINGFVNLVMELKKCCNHASLVRQYDDPEHDPAGKLQQLLKSSGKLILLDKLLCRLRDTGHRVLIFSQMVMMLDILQEYLKLRRFTAQRLDGSMRADLRKQALDHFNAEGSTDFCFLLSTRAGGLGINLATADTVIIFDSDWNPQNDLQAMSRAHRIGQTKTVNIYRLVTRGSVEEEIVERAKRKLVLDHLVIQRMDTTGRTVLHKSDHKGGSSSLPFDKHDLNDILKFGAQELFKEADGEEQEPEVDIDKILQVAETRDADEAQETGNDLLNAFKYANFAIDEEKDVAMAGEREYEWDSIIPEDKIKKMEDEEREKELRELELGPRERKKVQETPSAAGKENRRESVADDSDESDSDSGGRKKKKKAFGDFSTSEIKRFVRCIRKFARPIERLDAIAQEAELEEHGTGELKRLVEAFLTGCDTAVKEYAENEEKLKDANETKETEDKKKADKGPTFKFANVVDVNVRQFTKTQNELEPLHLLLATAEAEGKFSNWKPNIKPRPQNGWDVPWTAVDDAAILKGIHKYGAGSWEAIKMDPSLGLADKIHLKDKVKKPQPKHVGQRAEYLLKLIGGVGGGAVKKEKKGTDGGLKERKRALEREKDRERKKKNREEKKKDGGEKDEKEKKEKKKEVVKVVKKDHHHNHHREKKEGGEKNIERDSRESGLESFLNTIIINMSTYGPALDDKEGKVFTECVSMMRPVHKYIKRLSSDDEKEKSKSVQRIGEHAREEMKKLKKRRPESNISKWYNYVWIFIAKFCSQEPMDLLIAYRTVESKNHKHKDKKDHKKDGKGMVEREGEKKKEKSDHHHHTPSSSSHRRERDNHHHHPSSSSRDRGDRGDRGERGDRDHSSSHHRPSSAASSHYQRSGESTDYRSPLKPPTSITPNGWRR